MNSRLRQKVEAGGSQGASIHPSAEHVNVKTLKARPSASISALREVHFFVYVMLSFFKVDMDMDKKNTVRLLNVIYLSL